MLPPRAPAGVLKPAVSGVAIMPGMMVFTRTPRDPRSRAMGSAMPAVKRAVPTVTAANDADGVAVAIRELALVARLHLPQPGVHLVALGEDGELHRHPLLAQPVGGVAPILPCERRARGEQRRAQFEAPRLVGFGVGVGVGVFGFRVLGLGFGG